MITDRSLQCGRSLLCPLMAAGTVLEARFTGLCGQKIESPPTGTATKQQRRTKNREEKARITTDGTVGRWDSWLGPLMAAGTVVDARLHGLCGQTSETTPPGAATKQQRQTKNREEKGRITTDGTGR